MDLTADEGSRGYLVAILERRCGEIGGFCEPGWGPDRGLKMHAGGLFLGPRSSQLLHRLAHTLSSSGIPLLQPHASPRDLVHLTKLPASVTQEEARYWAPPHRHMASFLELFAKVNPHIEDNASVLFQRCIRFSISHISRLALHSAALLDNHERNAVLCSQITRADADARGVKRKYSTRTPPELSPEASMGDEETKESDEEYRGRTDGTVGPRPGRRLNRSGLLV